ncbi:hypothetical protein [Candidatus Dactylopiibacterium carminicum]|uniref:hypothetical protein n=1 Tax=Candidatus Dactylopiibacterium carminicum TaxID=857335 RepID=UPI001140EF9B|nr:hypothetical protein [Candidatus Dactylopiibacterium carminicum]
MVFLSGMSKSVHAMPSSAERILGPLASGPLIASQLIWKTEVSQPTLLHVMAELGERVVRIEAARSIQCLTARP